MRAVSGVVPVSQLTAAPEAALTMAIVTYIGKDIHGLPSFRLSDSVDGDCYVHACVKSEEEYTGIQVGDTITVTGNFHILSDDWGLVLKQSAVNQ